MPNGSHPLSFDPAPYAAHLLEGDELSWGQKGELTGLQTCIQTLADKKLKLVNVVQVMLIRLILPFQRWAFNLWEFDPAQHQTLNRLFDMMYEDAWRMLFKGAEAPASAAEDRGFSTQHHVHVVSYFCPFTGY